MKTNRPQVSFVPLHNRKKKDGSIPVQVVVCWKGHRVRKNTGVSVQKWHDRIMSYSPQLRAVKNELEDRIDALMTQGGDFTAEDVMTPTKVERTTFMSVMTALITRRHLKEITVKKYLRAYKAFSKYFGDESILLNVTQSQLEGMARQWHRDGLANGTIWTNLSTLASVYNFGVEEELIAHNPFKKWKYKAVYKPENHPKALTEEEVELMWKWWEESHNIAALTWFASYFFNGLALVDIIGYNWNELEVKEYDNRKFYVGTTHRSKTNALVPITAPVNDKTSQIYEALLKVDFSVRPPQAWNDHVGKRLRRLAPVKGVTQYSARHTYCTMLLSKGAPLNDICTLMGRTVNNIAVYIRQVYSHEHLASLFKAPIEIEI